MTRIPVGAPSRSVTALGWVFTVLGAMVPAALVLPDLQLSAWEVAGVALLATLCAVVGVGLLQRLDWARRTFIALLGGTVGLLALGLWLQWQWLHTAPSIQEPLAALLGSLVLSALLVWVIRRLVSPRVRREFA